MKLSLILLISFSAIYANATTSVRTVRCELQNFAKCTDCKQRIPASCEDRSFNGSIDLGTRPISLHWKSYNSTSGTEKITIVKNKNKTLKQILSEKNESELIAIEIPASTALFKDQKGTEIAAKMDSLTGSKPAQRGIASEGPASTNLGGIRRAQEACGKKGCL